MSIRTDPIQDAPPGTARSCGEVPARRRPDAARRREKARRPLLAWLTEQRPDIEDPAELIAAGRVRVDGVVRTNPAFPVRRGAGVAVAAAVALRGEAKLRAALQAFVVPLAGRVALDVGAAAGGFTRVLLGAGARRVYAVDVGHGQLLGSLRQDTRVVNLEATNVASLTRRLVPEPVDVVSIDVTYLSLASAVAQLAPLTFAPGAHLIGLVKPMFELRLGAPPEDPARLARALERAAAGVEAAGWRVLATTESPVRGARGAREWLLHARCLPSRVGGAVVPPTPARQRGQRGRGRGQPSLRSAQRGPETVIAQGTR